MRRDWWWAFVALSMLFVAPAWAQDGEGEEEEEAAEAEDDFDELGAPDFGGFGFFSPGLFIGEFELLAKDLARSESLGPDSAPSPFGLMIGGGGRTLIGGRFMIGGKGYGVFSMTGSNDVGEVTMSGGGGGFDFGFTIVNENPWLVYPFIGLGGAGMTMEITNNSPREIFFGSDQTIAPGQKATFNTGFFTFEAGAGAQYLLHDGNGGFNLGVEAGLLATIGQATWLTETGDPVAGTGRVKLDGFYIRLTIGGGGFELAEPVAEEDDEDEEGEGDDEEDDEDS